MHVVGQSNLNDATYQDDDIKKDVTKTGAKGFAHLK